MHVDARDLTENFASRTRIRAVPIIFTIGHSTRPMAEFTRLLKAHGVERLIDVRTIPQSRHNPQFNRDQLSPALQRSRIHYRHMPGLGGLRRARPIPQTSRGGMQVSVGTPITCRPPCSKRA